MIYTTNVIESLNRTLRRLVGARGYFPTDELALKLIWLQLREFTRAWKMPLREWHVGKAQFALLSGEMFKISH